MHTAQSQLLIHCSRDFFWICAFIQEAIRYKRSATTVWVAETARDSCRSRTTTFISVEMMAFNKTHTDTWMQNDLRLQNNAEITHVLGNGGAHLHGSHTVNCAHMVAGELTSAFSA
jgi:hypothetical protein